MEKTKIFKALKITGIGFLALIVILIGAAMTYRTVKSQGVIEAYEVNKDAEGVKKILVATQERTFKNGVMKAVTDYYTDNDVYLNVIDVTNLNKENIKDYHGVIIFSTIESSKPHEEVEKFLLANNDLENLFVYHTADSGNWDTNTYNIDATTSVSLIDESAKVSKIIIEKINSF